MTTLHVVLDRRRHRDMLLVRTAKQPNIIAGVHLEIWTYSDTPAHVLRTSMPSSMPSSVVAVSCEPSFAEMSAALSAFAKCCVRAALLAPPATPACGSYCQHRRHAVAARRSNCRYDMRSKKVQMFTVKNTPVMLRATLPSDAKGRNRAGTAGDSSSSANPARQSVRGDARSRRDSNDSRARQRTHVVQAVREEAPLLGVGVEGGSLQGGEEHAAHHARHVAQEELEHRAQRRRLLQRPPSSH